jgi:hypothetical protein
MSADPKIDEKLHEYNDAGEPDEDLSYKEETTVTEDAHRPEPGPPEEFGTQRPHSRD